MGVAGVSYASIPDHSGVIHACYPTSGTLHALSIIDSAKTAACPTGYKGVKWDQTGPAGPQGVIGAGGSERPDGTSRATGRHRRSRGHAGQQGPAGTPGISNYQIVTASTSYTAQYGSTYQLYVDAYCPGGDDLLGGGVQSNDSAEYIQDSGPFMYDGEIYNFWNVDFVIRSDSGYGETGTVTAYAICAQVNGAAAAAEVHPLNTTLAATAQASGPDHPSRGPALSGDERPGDDDEPHSYRPPLAGRRRSDRRRSRCQAAMPPGSARPQASRTAAPSSGVTPMPAHPACTRSTSALMANVQVPPRS